MAIKGSTNIVTKGLKLLYDAQSIKNFSLDNQNIEVLVVGGGGGGGANHAGGGGGGGVVYINNYKIQNGDSITATVGYGGTAAPSPNGPVAGSGGDSVFGHIRAYGGGGGGNRNDAAETNPGQPGASGGGGGGAQTVYPGNYPAGSGIPGQGNPGGRAVDLYGGGGGGAGSSGRDGYVPGNPQTGNGGIGTAYSISGTIRYYGGGGGAGYNSISNGGRGGLGGGGDGGQSTGQNGTPGLPNTGGGGGGGGAGGTAGSPGGTGVIITRYKGPQRASGGNIVEYKNGYTIHTFTSSGTFSVPASPAAPANLGVSYGYQNLVSENSSALRVGNVLWSTGNGGSATFNGNGSRFITGPVGGDFNEFSVLVFFYPTSVANYRNVLDGNYQAFTPNGNIGPRLEMNSTGNMNWIMGRGEHTNNSYNAFTAVSPTISANNWYFCAVTRNTNQKVNCYFNGSQIVTDADNTVGFVGEFRNLAIGRGFHLGNDAERSFQGSIPLVMVYNRALSTAEVIQNYNNYKGRYGL